MVQGFSDNQPLLDLGRSAEPGSTVLAGTGLRGLPSQVLAARFGSCWTHAGDGVALGQIPADRLR